MKVAQMLSLVECTGEVQISSLQSREDAARCQRAGVSHQSSS